MMRREEEIQKKSEVGSRKSKVERQKAEAKSEESSCWHCALVTTPEKSGQPVDFSQRIKEISPVMRLAVQNRLALAVLKIVKNGEQGAESEESCLNSAKLHWGEQLSPRYEEQLPEGEGQSQRGERQSLKVSAGIPVMRLAHGAIPMLTIGPDVSGAIDSLVMRLAVQNRLAHSRGNKTNFNSFLYIPFSVPQPHLGAGGWTLYQTNRQLGLPADKFFNN